MLTCRVDSFYDSSSIEANIEAQQYVRSVLVPKLADLTPRGGAYLNEGDFGQPDFQHVYYGDNYNRLLAIKRRYDPHNLFFGSTAVGSEAWQIERDGRLCRVR